MHAKIAAGRGNAGRIHIIAPWPWPISDGSENWHGAPYATAARKGFFGPPMHGPQPASCCGRRGGTARSIAGDGRLGGWRQPSSAGRSAL